VWEALGTSWRIAIDATILAVVLGLLVAVLVSRPARSPGGLRWRRLLDRAGHAAVGGCLR
jgi:thiamine transport system permease protein